MPGQFSVTGGHAFIDIQSPLPKLWEGSEMRIHPCLEPSSVSFATLPAMLREISGPLLIGLSYRLSVVTWHIFTRRFLWYNKSYWYYIDHRNQISFHSLVHLRTKKESKRLFFKAVILLNHRPQTENQEAFTAFVFASQGLRLDMVPVCPCKTLHHSFWTDFLHTQSVLDPGSTYTKGSRLYTRVPVLFPHLSNGDVCYLPWDTCLLQKLSGENRGEWNYTVWFSIGHPKLLI